MDIMHEMKTTIATKEIGKQKISNDFLRRLVFFNYQTPPGASNIKTETVTAVPSFD